MQDAMHSTLLYGPYFDVLGEINAIAESIGDPVEGNLIYTHNSTALDESAINPVSFAKRRNFVAACRQSSHILELGFGAGHSALLALACGLEYHGVDICKHRYAKPVADYLKSRFPERFFFYQGACLRVMPNLWKYNDKLPSFNMLHYDGGHDRNECIMFFEHAFKHSTDNAWCVFDDSELQPIRDAYNHFLENKQVKPDMPFGWEPFERHAIGRRAG